MTVNYNVANPDTLSNGDTLNITSMNCVEDGMSINGGLQMTFTNINMSPSPPTA